MSIVRTASAPEVGAVTPAMTSPKRRPRWFNARVVAGVAIIAISTLVGAVMFAAPVKTPVWVAARTLPAGAVLRAVDVYALPVSVPAGYAPSATAIVGKRLTRPIGVGELVPTSALGPAVYGDFRSIALPVEAEHSPPSLSVGHYVDIWVTPRDAAGTLGMPFLALAAVPVSAVNRDTAGDATSAATVVVDVKPDQARTLVTGLRRGVIDLVRVPGVIQ